MTALAATRVMDGEGRPEAYSILGDAVNFRGFDGSGRKALLMPAIGFWQIESGVGGATLPDKTFLGMAIH